MKTLQFARFKDVSRLDQENLGIPYRVFTKNVRNGKIYREEKFQICFEKV